MENIFVTTKTCNPMYDNILSVGYCNKSGDKFAIFYNSGLRAITDRLYIEVLEKSKSLPLTDHDENLRHGYNRKFQNPYTDYFSKQEFMNKFNIIELDENEFYLSGYHNSHRVYYYDNKFFRGYVTLDGNYNHIRVDRFTPDQLAQFEGLMTDKSDLYYYSIFPCIIIQDDLDMKILQKSLTEK